MSNEFLSDELEGIENASNAPRRSICAGDSRCGFFPDMGNDEYFADPIEEGSLSQSGIKILLKETPLEFAFQHPRINLNAAPDIVSDSVAMRRGDVVHQLALGKGKGYAVGDFPAWQSKEAKSFRDNAIADGLTPIKRKDFEDAEVMAEVLVEQIERACDGADYQTEVAVIWREPVGSGFIYLKGRFDVWCPEKLLILDPKITERLSNGGAGENLVQRHAINMGWDRQAALYIRAVEVLMPETEGRVRFENLMVKPSEPFVARRVRYDRTWLRSSIFECKDAFYRFAECQNSGIWPSYPDEAEVLLMPAWEEKRRIERELAGDEASI